MTNHFAILNELEEVIYISDIETHELLFLNTAARKLLSKKETDNPIGRKCYEVLQGKQSPCEFCTNHLLSKDAFYSWECANLKYGRHFLVKDKLLFWKNRKMRLEIAIDITEQQKTKEKIRHDLKNQSAIVESLQVLEQEQDLDRSIEKIMGILGRCYMADRGYVFEFDTDGNTATNTYEWCAHGVVPQMRNLRNVPLESMDRWIEAFHKKGEVVIHSLGKELEPESFEYKLLHAQEIEARMAVPIMDEGRITGCLGVDNPHYALGDTFLLRSMAYFIKSYTEKQRAKKHLERLSLTDSLTGLGNRNQYLAALRGMRSSEAHDFGVAFIDINGLKAANDAFGHDYGDRILIKIAGILRDIFGDNVFRTGGDEFIVLCRDISHKEFVEKADAMRVKIAATPDCRISCGATWRNAVEDIDALISYADELMYIEKQSYYKSNLGKRPLHHSSIMEETLRELEQGQFLVYFQPKISLKSGELGGAEALIRKRGLDGKIIPPMKFIPLLESELLIRHIDFFVLHEACKTLKRWKEQARKMVPVSVNISRLTLMEHNIVEKLSSICALYKIPCSLIDIEVTESIGTINPESLRVVSHKLREEGFSLSLDDFGSKYCNFSILTNVEFTCLKLDKSIIDQLCVDARSRIVIKHCIQMCMDLKDISSVAEGIENKQQLDLLRLYNCDYGQGYYFSKPLSIYDFERRYCPEPEKNAFSEKTM